MAGKYRIKAYDEVMVNAHARVPEDMYEAVKKQARTQHVSASSYYTRWILDGYAKEFKKGKK